MATKKVKNPKDSLFVTRKIVKPDELNPNGTLFGGIIMSWIDEVAFMSARRYSERPFVVTASIDNITFLAPLQLGDHVVLSSSVNFVGSSSMEIGVKVEKENPYTGQRTPTTSAYLTFVALNKAGRPRPVPILEPDTPDDKRRQEEARIRVKVRKRLRERLRKKFGLLSQTASPFPQPTEDELRQRSLTTRMALDFSHAVSRTLRPLVKAKAFLNNLF